MNKTLREKNWLNITELLRDLYRKGVYNYKHDRTSVFDKEDEEINQALSDIDNIILPEKKEIKGWDTSSPIYDRRVGFNQCREIMQARMR